MSDPQRTRRQRPGLSRAKLAKMIEEATLDAYGESEQVTGWFTIIEENLATPFETVVLGVPVTVERVDLDRKAQRSSRFAAADVRGKYSRFWICRCRRRFPMARSGSKRIAAGTPETPDLE